MSTVQQEIVSFYAPIDQINSSKIPWKLFITTADMNARGMAFIGDDAFAITHNNAKNYKWIATNMKNPDWKNTTTVIAERPNQTMESFINAKDYLLVVHSDGINNYLTIYNIKAKKTTAVKLPNRSVYLN